MKILYVITKSNWGGAQRHVYDLAVSMKEKGHEVAVALGGDGALRKKLEVAGIYTHSIATLGRDVSPGKDAGSFKELYSIVKHRKPDILHLHSPKAGGMGSVVGRLCGVKNIIYTVHGWTWNEDRPFSQKISIIFFSWLTVLLCHRTIVISNNDYLQANRLPWIKSKISLVPLGIRLPTFVSVDGAKQFVSKTIDMEMGELSKKILIVSIAELHPNKGMTYLIEAFVQVANQYPNAILVIVGDGQEKADLHMLIKYKKLEKNVFLAGHIDNACEYLKAFNLFVLPSIKEGLPYVLLEAGAASLPVVSTTVGGIPDIIEDMKSGVLVQPKNIRELSHAISFMIEHPEERRKYGATLKEAVATKFSMEKMIGTVEGLYLK